jgi:hypothetical protein
MKQLPLSGPRAIRPRPLLALVAAAALGLALWGTGDTNDPEAGAAPQAAIDTIPGRNATVAGLARQPIGFPTRVAAALAGANLFGVQSWYVPPPPPPAAAPLPPSKPTAPPLPFSYMGRYASTGGKAVYYLVKGDRIFDVHLGDTLDGVYTVDAVEGDELLLTYTPLMQRQALNIRK